MNFQRIVSLPVFLMLCVQLCAMSVKAQSSSDTLYLVKKKCYRNEKKLSVAELSKTFKTVPEAYKEYQRYNNKALGSTVVSILTGFCLGYGLTPFLIPSVANNNPSLHMALAVVGIGGLFWSISLEQKKMEPLKRAILIYNSKLSDSTSFNP